MSFSVVHLLGYFSGHIVSYLKFTFGKNFFPCQKFGLSVCLSFRNSFLSFCVRNLIHLPAHTNDSCTTWKLGVWIECVKKSLVFHAPKFQHNRPLNTAHNHKFQYLEHHKSMSTGLRFLYHNNLWKLCVRGFNATKSVCPSDQYFCRKCLLKIGSVNDLCLIRIQIEMHGGFFALWPPVCVSCAGFLYISRYVFMLFLFC